ncbi:Preprotein translocase subunit YajC [Streptococcus sp. DD10]|uniref:preprotein translocase subunit YajC n=1 Tax=Streptococcus sp. DD10 TaxID=1777878 RepID=UPI0007982CCD|nr:preprotein translocase subunit YajC [Streptococcus sp. DD10]KXT74503.1 Preprotein translocase subunit YajC [Streptococcus sp. DD10]
MNFATLFIFFALMVGMIFFQTRSQKKQAEKRLDSLKKLSKGNEVITIGGLYGTVDEIDIEKQIITLDVDGVFLPFELNAIKTVLPVTEVVIVGANDSSQTDLDVSISNDD